MSDIAADTKTELGIDFPSLWGVKFLNDDYTPIEFVIFLLIKVFGLSDEEATNITLRVHKDGEAIVGAYTKDIALTKALTAENTARQYGHPLRLDAVEV